MTHSIRKDADKVSAMINKGLKFSGCVGLMLAAIAAQAQEQKMPAQTESRLMGGAGYFSPMASYILSNDSAFDDGLGATVALGYRKGWWALEGSVLISRYKGAGEGVDTDVDGGTINALVFPLKSVPNLFGIVGGGALGIDQQPQIGRSYSLTTLEAGSGYLLPLAIGRYDFGIRADVRYRYGSRQERVQPDPGDYAISNDFSDVVINIGLQLPLGSRPPVLPAEDKTLTVVPPAAANETTLPVCSDGQDNDGDGLKDFPADKACSGAEGADEREPCKSPATGKPLSLQGCSAGDVIVLRGVNFDYDQSRLMPGAVSILDAVAKELKAYPAIEIELSGHTDARGNDEYNQLLSQLRADAVVQHLRGHGIAAERMTAVGRGESQAVADNATEKGRDLNRRVELKISLSPHATGADQ